MIPRAPHQHRVNELVTGALEPGQTPCVSEARQPAVKFRGKGADSGSQCVCSLPVCHAVCDCLHLVQNGVCRTGAKRVQASTGC